jgi:hypothetical protein
VIKLKREDGELRSLRDLIDYLLKEEVYRYSPSTYAFTCGVMIAEIMITKANSTAINMLPEEPIFWEEDKWESTTTTKGNPFKKYMTKIAIIQRIKDIRKELYSLLEQVELKFILTKCRMNLGNVIDRLQQNNPYEKARVRRRYDKESMLPSPTDTSNEEKEVDLEEMEDLLMDMENLLTTISSLEYYNYWACEYMREACVDLNYYINLKRQFLVRNEEKSYDTIQNKVA